MPFTYMLRCADGSLYVGSTRGDLAVRVAQHNAGTGARYTAQRRPVTVLWSAQFELVTEAFALEKRLQNWSRAKRLALAEGRFDDLPGLSRRGGATRGLETGSAGAPPSSTTQAQPSSDTRWARGLETGSAGAPSSSTTLAQHSSTTRAQHSSTTRAQPSSTTRAQPSSTT